MRILPQHVTTQFAAAHEHVLHALSFRAQCHAMLVTTTTTSKILWPSFFPNVYFNFSTLSWLSSLFMHGNCNVTQGVVVVQSTYITRRRCILHHIIT